MKCIWNNLLAIQVRTTDKTLSNFFNIVTLKDLETITSTKVERSEITSLLDFKSNKIDTKINMQAIDILHKQIKHLSVVLIEILRRDSLKLIKPKDTQNITKK